MSDFIDKLKETFVTDDRWLYLVKGLGNTLIITLAAALIGIVLGFLVAMIRSTHKAADRQAQNRGFLLPHLSDRHTRNAYGGAADDYVFRYLRHA